MPSHAARRRPAPLRPSPATTVPAGAPTPVREAVRSPGPGAALPLQVARPIGASLGVDLSPVRLHTGREAARAADAASARAFTWGTEIFLGTGQQPTDLGLIAHEAAHVVQQQGGPAVQLFTPGAGDAYEHEARAASSAVLSGSAITVRGRTPGPAVQRDWLPAWARRGVEAVKSGASAVVSAVGDVAAAARARALAFVKDRAKSIPGYELLAFALGKDPITQQTVDRTAVNLIRALVGLIPGGTAMFENLQQAGVVQRAADWVTGEIAKLGLTWALIRGLFQQLWDSLSASDLLNLGGVFDRVRAIFGPPLERIKTFAIAAGKKLLELLFEGALALGGAAAQRVLGIFRRAAAVFDLIVKDPVKFVGNLVAAVKGGFLGFASNILEHLRNALFEWLMGALKGALTLPAKWDLRGIIDVVLQVLGLTYDKLRERLVKLLGEPAVRAIETAFEFIKLIVTQGLAAAWDKLLEFATGLVDTVIGGIRDWAAKSIVGAAITKLVTLFNPVGAVIQGIISIYNTVMFFIERAQQIAALVESIVSSVENIARGNLGGAIAFVEKTMARTLPVIISFLARFIGLGNVSGAIKGIIAKIQGVVGKALDKVTDFVVKLTKPIVAALRGSKPGETASVAGAAGGAFPDVSFDTDGVKHRLYFRAAGGDEEATVESDPRLVREFLTSVEPTATPEQKKEIGVARKLQAKVTYAKKKLKDKPSDSSRKKALEDATNTLKESIAKVFKGVPLDTLKKDYEFEGEVKAYGGARSPRPPGMEADHQPQAALLWYVASQGLFAATRLARDIASSEKARGGWSILLNLRRHRLGATYGKAPDLSVVATELAATTPADEKVRRAAVVKKLVAARRRDVKAILAVIKNPLDHAAWEDVRLRAAGDKKKGEALQKIVVEKVTAGERDIEAKAIEDYSN